MDTTIPELHVVLFPLMADGHIIPTLDIARLFSGRGVKATIISTPHNVATIANIIDKSGKAKAPVSIEVFHFISQEAGLPQGCENLEQAHKAGVAHKFLKAGGIMREQLEQYIEKTRPDCLVADMFFDWACDTAAKFNIPTLVFHGFSFFSLCAKEVVRLYQPHKNVSSDTEPFTLPCLPDEVKMTGLQIPGGTRKDEVTDFTKIVETIRELELKSHGVIVNSFYELEPHYADFLRRELRMRAWHVGPVSLCNRSIEDRVHRGKPASINEDVCLKWLKSKKPESVIYICFGSTVNLIAPQLHEIAMALEASAQNFIWVIRNDDERKNKEWMPPGFEQKIENKGLIINGWAPQLLILEHESTGGFLTHCGWNSALEGISAGVPMITWPNFAEQFYNEKLVTQILKIAVAVGSKKWSQVASIDDVIKKDAIEKAIRDLMVGEEAKERRTRAKKLKEMAWKAVEEGGSSYSDLSALIEELKNYQASKKE